MELIELQNKHREKYQSFVSANGCFLQDWDWGDFQEHIGKKVLRVALVEGDEYLATAQIILNELQGKKYFFLPYGPVLKGNEDLLKEFLKNLKQKYADQIFFRIEPQFEIGSKIRGLRKSLDLDPHKTLVLDLRQDLEEIQKGMHHKTRYNIKVSAKHNVIVNTGKEFSAIEKEIFQETASRAGIRFQSPEYFSQLLEFFKEGKNISASLYRAEKDGDTIAANLMVTWNKTVTYLFGGSSNMHRNVMAPYALHWQAIQEYKSQGFELYDFWGVEEDPNHPWYGFSRFKLGFGGKVINYAGTYDYLLSPAWYNAYIFFRKLNRILRK